MEWWCNLLYLFILRASLTCINWIYHLSGASPYYCCWQALLPRIRWMLCCVLGGILLSKQQLSYSHKTWWRGWCSRASIRRGVVAHYNANYSVAVFLAALYLFIACCCACHHHNARVCTERRTGERLTAAHRGYNTPWGLVSRQAEGSCGLSVAYAAILTEGVRAAVAYSANTGYAALMRVSATPCAFCLFSPPPALVFPDHCIISSLKPFSLPANALNSFHAYILPVAGYLPAEHTRYAVYLLEGTFCICSCNIAGEHLPTFTLHLGKIHFSVGALSQRVFFQPMTILYWLCCAAILLSQVIALYACVIGWDEPFCVLLLIGIFCSFAILLLMRYHVSVVYAFWKGSVVPVTSAAHAFARRPAWRWQHWVRPCLCTA